MATKAKATKEQGKGAGRGSHPNSRANLKKGAWEPGESGNPAGLPPGTKQRSTVLKKWLEVAVDLKKLPPGTPAQKGTVEDQIVLALINKAVAGDVPAIREVQDSMYGKIPQKVILVEEARAAFRAFMDEHPEAEAQEVARVYARTFDVPESELITDSVN